MSKLFSLECIITGNPLPELTWLFNDRKIISGDSCERKSEELNVHTVRHRLLISSKNKRLGIYKAQAQNIYGHTVSTCHVKKSAQSIDHRKFPFEESESQVSALPIQRRRSNVTQTNLDQATQKPIIIQGLSKFQIDLGSPCALTCKSKYDTEQQWIKDGKPLDTANSNDGNAFTKTDRSAVGNTHVLNIKNFKQENTGQYEIILKNKLGQISSQGQLDMKGIPPTFIVEPKATAVVKGKMIEFNCRVAGSPKPEVNLFLFQFKVINSIFHLGSLVP